MEYALNNVTSVADCNTLLTQLNNEKGVLEHRLTGLNYQYNNFGTNSQELTAELNSTTAMIGILADQIATYPDGPDKNKAIADKKKYEWRLEVLNQRYDNYGSVAVVRKAEDINAAEAELAVKNALIASVEARVIQLGSTS